MTSGLSYPLPLSSVPFFLCGFIFSSASCVPVMLAITPPDLTSSDYIRRERAFLSQTSPSTCPVHFGSDQIRLGPTSDPVTLVGICPCLNEASSQSRVVPESWRPCSSNVQKLRRVKLGSRMAKRGSFTGLLGLQQESHHFPRLKLMDCRECALFSSATFIHSPHTPVSCRLRGNPMSILGLVRPRAVMGLV